MKGLGDRNPRNRSNAGETEEEFVGLQTRPRGARCYNHMHRELGASLPDRPTKTNRLIQAPPTLKKKCDTFKSSCPGSLVPASFAGLSLPPAWRSSPCKVSASR